MRDPIALDVQQELTDEFVCLSSTVVGTSVPLEVAAGSQTDQFLRNWHQLVTSYPPDCGPGQDRATLTFVRGFPNSLIICERYYNLSQQNWVQQSELMELKVWLTLDNLACKENNIFSSH